MVGRARRIFVRLTYPDLESEEPNYPQPGDLPLGACPRIPVACGATQKAGSRISSHSLTRGVASIIKTPHPKSNRNQLEIPLESVLSIGSK